MKKPIYKYRNNGGGHHNSNQIYSLNYKFDSNSIAGKCSGTALELIKRYNELARDAQNYNDVVNAEIFRQYAEHYRKIVTDINEKKNAKMNYFKKDEEAHTGVIDGNVTGNSDVQETENNVPQSAKEEVVVELASEHKKIHVPKKREFTIVEIKEEPAEIKEHEAKKIEEKTEKKIRLRTPRAPKKTTEETVVAL